MRLFKHSVTRSILVVSCCAALAASLIVPAAAKAWTYSRTRSSWGYSSGDVRYLQIQSQSAAEEARCEA